MPDGAPFFTGVRQPPSNLQAELALLGALLQRNSMLDRCEGVEPHHFVGERHGELFAAIRLGVTEGRRVDGVSLAHRFDSALIADAIASAIGITTAPEYARAVRDCWLRREAIEVCAETVAACHGPGAAEGEEIVAEALNRLLELGEDASAARGTDFATAAPAVVQRAAAAFRGDADQSRLDTGLPSVDRLWNGLWPGQLYYLMARSRTGKTPAMMQFARHVAARLQAEAQASGEPSGHVHVFSLEMTAEDLLTVNLASVTRWTADQLRSGQIGDDKAWLDLDRAAAELGRLPIHIDDAAEMDLGALMMRARAVKRQKRTRLICIDFRELIRRPREHARMGLPEWIPFLGYQLKALAKALHVPVLALAQINKSRDNAEVTRPTLADLPYDGGQAADAVFALHRPELYMADEAPRSAMKMTAEKQAAADSAWHDQREAARGLAEFLALKRRFGPAGLCRLHFDGPRMLLREISDSAPMQSDLLDVPPAMSEADYG
jgi:replicative DNA helicase